MDVVSLFKPTVYPLNISSREYHTRSHIVSLVDLCANKIVEDASTTNRIIQIIPSDLCYNLMKAAVHSGRDRSIEVLVANWPSVVLSLKKFAPPLFENVAIRYSEVYLGEAMRRAVKYTTCLAHTFVECLKKRTPTQLRCLDLTGYPAAEVILNYLASHVLLAFNEQKQSEIIQMYNHVTQDLPDTQRHRYNVTNTIPDNSYMILLDSHLENTDAHMEVCRALRICNDSHCTFKICLNTVDINCLGVARISVLLEQVPQETLKNLSIQFNAINAEGFQVLVPVLQKFSNLVSLDISCNGTVFSGHEEACDTLCKILCTFQHLRRLDISNNRTKHKLRTILSVIPGSLQYLRLCGCGVSELDLIYLRQSHHSNTLQEIDLSDNVMTHERFLCVMDLLAVLASHLYILELEECTLEHSDLVTLLGYITNLKKLQYINVARNDNLNGDLLCESIEKFADIADFKALKASFPTDCYVSVEPEEIDPVKNAFRHRMLELVTSCCDRKRRPKFSVALSGP